LYNEAFAFSDETLGAHDIIINASKMVKLIE